MPRRNRVLGPRAARIASVSAGLWLCAATAHAQGPGFANVPRQKGELLAGPITPSIGRTAVLVGLALGAALTTLAGLRRRAHRASGVGAAGLNAGRGRAVARGRPRAPTGPP